MPRTKARPDRQQVAGQLGMARRYAQAGQDELAVQLAAARILEFTAKVIQTSAPFSAAQREQLATLLAEHTPTLCAEISK